jgi:hypothetical protein
MHRLSPGFFFCGIRLLPVEYASLILMYPNSADEYKMRSSAMRLRCVLVREAQNRNSTMKSRSETASRLHVPRHTPERHSSETNHKACNAISTRPAHDQSDSPVGGDGVELERLSQSFAIQAEGMSRDGAAAQRHAVHPCPHLSESLGVSR